MNEWDAVLRTLADDPQQYDRQGGTVFFSRQGEEWGIELKEVPAGGLCVCSSDGNTYTPISSYIQKDILKLPGLAKQMVNASDRVAKTRPVAFVEGPATLEVRGQVSQWDEASSQFASFLQTSEPGTTRLVELMAPAGRGKTMLLETMSRNFALSYQPDPFPVPLLLKVDLLGRYVGTVDDAIAGSLNNEYFFPGLSQKDVALSVRHKWLVLALDGFDELVARVGTRDAFSRITELLDQLDGQGTVILSARESFFELYQVTAAIKTFLQPRRGNYDTAVIRLDRWDRKQGEQVFQRLGSPTPEEDFSELAATFENDPELIFHPFFLIKLAQLWRGGERFSDAAGQTGGMGRTKYVIETFVDREAREKWIDKDGNPLISSGAHRHLLAGIAEEMWRSGAFVLDLDELRLAAQIGIEHLNMQPSLVADALERVPTHAALVNRGRGISFLHDRFLNYFLGVRVVELMRAKELVALQHVLSARELAPEAAHWVAWHWNSTEANVRTPIRVLTGLLDATDDAVLRLNVSDLIARVCDRSDATGTVLKQLEFVGDACTSRQYEGIEFLDCRFWHSDLSGSHFTNCVFRSCEFGDVKIDDDTLFGATCFEQSSMASLETSSEQYFAPNEIYDILRNHGMIVKLEESANLFNPSSRNVRREVVKGVDGLVKASTKTWDVAVEDMEESHGHAVIRSILKPGLKHEILKKVAKSTSGPKKTFIRFGVDRTKLMAGLKGPIGDSRIDSFWSELEG